MKNILKFCLWVCCLVGMGQAQAALYTLRATGTIYQGYDSQGFFGGGDLTHRSIDFTQIFDSSTSGQLNFPNASSLIGTAGFGSLTVGGITLAALPDINLSHTLSLSDGVTVGGPGPGKQDEIFGVTNGKYLDGVTFVGYADVLSYANAFVPNLDFSQTLTYHPVAGDSSISTIQWNKNVGGVNVGTYGYYTIDTITLNGTVDSNAVPEPESYVLVLTGLGLIAFTARRCRTAVPQQTLSM